jgi:dienelactone hydrolase
VVSLADSFAKAGYLVVEPDYFRGDPAPADLAGPGGRNMGSWMAKHPVSDIDSIIAATIKHMRESLGVKRIGTVGYCFGGKYVARFLAKGKGVDAGFMAHPSMMEQAEIEAISAPLSIGAAGE